MNINPNPKDPAPSGCPFMSMLRLNEIFNCARVSQPPAYRPLSLLLHLRTPGGFVPCRPRPLWGALCVHVPRIFVMEPISGGKDSEESPLGTGIKVQLRSRTRLRDSCASSLRNCDCKRVSRVKYI